MDNKKNVRVDSELYVNEATLELLRRRIESDVKGSFFRWIGLPIGGAGILAILLTIFIWIPDKISTIIEKNPTVQERLNSSAVAYLNDPERGQKFVNAQLEAYLLGYLQDPQRGRKFVREQIEGTAQPLRGSGRG